MKNGSEICMKHIHKEIVEVIGFKRIYRNGKSWFWVNFTFKRVSNKNKERVVSNK